MGLVALLSLASPAVQNCGPEQREEESIDAVASTARTDSEGVAYFSHVNPITVVDAEGRAIEGIKVTGYDLPAGDAYLAEGGIAAFADRRQQRGRLTLHLENRRLVIRPYEGLTLFDRYEQEVIFDLTRWIVGQEYSCDGIYTTEQLIEQRDHNAKLISYIPKIGTTVKFAYDVISYLIDIGVLDDLPPGKKWFVLYPANPTAPPLVVQRGLAQVLFDEDTYDTLNRVCVDRTSGSSGREGQECDDGLFCTYDDRIVNGVCKGTPRTCDDGIRDNIDYCDEEMQLCIHKRL
jgi:hypothetical protein